jgi:hypothetical protein
MSPSDRGRRPAASPSNVYTAFLATSLGVLLATALFVTLKCLSQYGSPFTMPQ